MSNINYYLPKSVTSHPITGKRDPYDAYLRLLSWLDEFTEYKMNSDPELKLVVPVDHLNSNEFDFLQSIFGSHKVWGKQNNYTTQTVTHEFWAYKFSLDKIKDVFHLISENKDFFDKFKLKVVLSINFSFKGSKSKESNFLCFFETRSHIIPEIYFPFEKRNDEFQEFYNTITPKLPLKLDEKYLHLSN